MRTVSSGLATHLAQEVTTLAWCWLVTRRDGQVFGFTTHDVDLLIGGVTYLAETGMLATAAQTKAGSSVDNMEIAGALDSAAITVSDLMAGLWDGATVLVFIVNWANLAQGSMIVQSGTLGRVANKIGVFNAEMRSLSQMLQNTVGRIMTRTCDANLGDARCTVNLATFTVTGTVSANSADGMTFAASALPASIGGLLTWTSGANNGLTGEVKALSGGNITLALPMAHAVAAGDAYSVYAGCDKNRSTCIGTFNNVINFRGFPDIPGMDAVLAYPNAA